jgi:hypothetical protein
VRNEKPCSRADRCVEDRDVTIVRCRAVDLDRDGTKEFLEKRRGLRELRREIPPDFGDGRLRKHETKTPEFAEDQDRVGGARAGQQSGDQDVGGRP